MSRAATLSNDAKVVGIPNRHSASWPWHNDIKEWRGKQDRLRLKEDGKQLSRIFAQAANVPALKEALDWAKEHGLTFILDHQTTAGGYYFLGSGVVAISAKCAYADNPRYVIGVVVHEIRHAWQDYYGMIATLPAESFQKFFTNMALTEADAEAHAYLAREQYNASRTAHVYRRISDKSHPSAQGLKRALDASLESIADEKAFLWEAFVGWFTGFLNNHYGKNASQLVGHKLGLPRAVKPDNKFAYTQKEMEAISPFDPSRREELLRLGKCFTGGNYLRLADKDIFPTKILSTSLCQRFFDPGRKKPFVLVDKIRKTLLQQNLGKETPRKCLP